MPTRVLETVLTGRDQLSPVLARAAVAAEQFENKVDDANSAAARSSTNAARVHQAAAKATADSATRVRAAAGEFEAAGADLGDAVGDGLKRNADRNGDDAGNKLSKGMQLAIVRNSPLIAAGIAAALAAGAPVAIAGALALFGGIGIVAAAQSDRVKAAWAATWHTISTGTVADAAVMQNALVNMAARVSAGFEQMRPQLRQIFADAAPLLERFTDNLVRAAQNAMPGFVNAVHSAGPVVDGLGSLMERVGTGISQFFTLLSQHAPAAGQAFDALGRIIAALLPILGNLLGQGAELASVVLPPLATVLEAVGKALNFIAPVLPAVAAGFAAFKIVQALSGPLETFSGKLLKLADKDIPGISTAAGVAGQSVGMLGKALPVLGVAVAALGALFTEVEKTANDFATAIRKGGVTAQQAKDNMAAMRTALSGSQGGLQGLAANFLNSIGVGQVFNYTIDQTNEKLREQWKSMSPLAQAQAKVAEWTATLTAELQNENSTSSNVEAAKRRLAYWSDQQAQAQARQNAAVADYIPSADAAAAAQDDLATALRMGDADAAAEALARYRKESGEAATEQNRLEQAIYGTTQAMQAEADQARSRVDAQFAYQKAVNGVEDAQKALDEAIRKHGAASEQAQRATLDLNQAYADQVDAAARIATSNLPATMNDQQKSIIGAKAALDELNKLMASGVTLPPELEAYRQQLIQITGQANGATLAQAELATAIGEIGFQVESLPDGKSIQIDAPTKDLIGQLQDLGFTVTTLPNGAVRVSADTDEAKSHLGDLSTLLAGIDATKVTPTADLDTGPFVAKKDATMADIFRMMGSKATPTVDLNTGPFNAGHGDAMGKIGQLNGQRPTPQAGLQKGQFDSGVGAIVGMIAALNRMSVTIHATANTSAAESALNFAARTRYSVVIQTVLPGKATGGPIQAVKAATGRKVFGPGGPTDDLVPARGIGGAPDYQVSPGEWIINAAVSRRQGDARMAALNAGLATIVPTAPPAMPGYGTSRGGAGGRAATVQVVERNPSLTYVDQRPAGGDTMPKLTQAWREMEFLARG